MDNPISQHRKQTETLARALRKTDVFHWLCQYGYFPESYVLPPCFKVVKRPQKPKVYFKIKKKGKQFDVPRTECVNVHFPKTDYADRNFGLIHPEIHNDIAYHISRNWLSVVKALIPPASKVTSYTFPIPIDAQHPGRLTFMRSGRMIYEFIGMVDDDIASIAYKYRYMVRADIKNFYPSIYTHSISWAIHGKNFIRKPQNLHNFRILGNRLDRLFQRANDGCTNGVPIGPVVSDVVAEIVASAVDVQLTKALSADSFEYEATRFKDDYRILVKTEQDARIVIKRLQAALRDYSLELSEEKTSIRKLPDGLFREWVSKYHVVHPKNKKSFTWKEFRELYLATLQIDREIPGTGVIDRFLADVVTQTGDLKVTLHGKNVEKAISMLLMMGNLRVKSFPKVIAILESVLGTPFGAANKNQVAEYLRDFLGSLSDDEERHKYLISWIGYFLVSNNLQQKKSHNHKDPITRSILNNRGALFKDCKEHKIFEGCRTTRKKISMMEHLDIFNPPQPN